MNRQRRLAHLEAQIRSVPREMTDEELEAALIDLQRRAPKGYAYLMGLSDEELDELVAKGEPWGGL